MTTADDKRLLDQVNAANNAGADECTCPYTDPSTWLSAASCGYGSGYEPGSMQEWNPDCPVHPADDTPPDTRSEVERCGAERRSDPNWNHTWIPCVLDRGHDGDHFSTSGCAGSEMRWPTTHPEAETLDELAQTLYAKDKTPGEEGWGSWEEHSEGVRDIWRRYARRFLASDWLAARERAAEVRALREVADRWENAVIKNTNTLDLEVAGRVVGWLRDRADRIEGDRG